MDNCIFCKIAKGIVPSKKIYENNSFFSIPDTNPILDGHSLVISKEHFETILDVPDNLSSELLDCIKRTARELMNDSLVEGFNILNNNHEVAGQIVKHVHFHILPRKKGDGKIKFINNVSEEILTPDLGLMRAAL